jgi:hypothetical protein
MYLEAAVGEARAPPEEQPAQAKLHATVKAMAKARLSVLAKETDGATDF